ncbi:TadE/TadG family type IV pilus assembly protein [Paenibacillus sp. MSJ-34]|uniref:TadE/TadG family type IV pilus assembly protein n=1 Tax=Paenibacillus sp. MSJ-34 TaxID=2841529 RepID=UPI001C127D7F|nr:TadE family protein [Paenibacillus sp. MSJ-34]MBU5440725.1 pilus assembly protein [Paenibacillus sp. MSJ-34]
MSSRINYSKISHRRGKWLSDERGSFTIEASMLFPLIFFILTALLFFCLYMYQKVVLVYVASTAVDRAAYSWDNSGKAPKTGEVPEGRHDGLYWRLSDDRALDVLFGLSQHYERARFVVTGRNGLHGQGASAEPSPGGGLPLTKMGNAARYIPQGLSGEMIYTNALLQRKVAVRLHNPLRFPPLEKIMGKVRVETGLSSSIVDPVEFVRTVELSRYYGRKFGTKEEGIDRDQAREVLRKKQK